MTGAVKFRRVLLTGAAGKIGSTIREGLRPDLAELRLTDRRNVVPAPAAPETFVLADLLDRAAVERAVSGVDAVIHLGGNPDEASFDDLIGPNVIGTFNLFDAARPRGSHPRRLRQLQPRHRLLSAFRQTHRRRADTAGQLVRRDQGLRRSDGAPVRSQVRPSGGRGSHRVLQTPAVGARELHTWLSPGDAVRLFRSCLTSESIGFLTIYGVSANTRTWWPPAEAARILGYEPEDDAEQYADELGESSERWQGGGFTAHDYGGWT